MAAAQDLEAAWRANYCALQAFVDKNGRMPLKTETSEDTPCPSHLGVWVCSQRRAYWQKFIPPERVALLEALPGWSWKRNYENTWRYAYGALCEFVRTHDRLPKKPEMVGDLWLGLWCMNQRAAQSRGALSAERAELLDRVPGWYWERDTAWCGMLATLHAFVRTHRRLPEEGDPAAWRPLGNWVGLQRRARATGRLSAERAAQLDQVPGWRESADDDLFAGSDEEGSAAKRRR